MRLWERPGGAEHHGDRDQRSEAEMNETLTRDRSGWQPLFEEISLGRRAQTLKIDVLDKDFGDQVEADGMPFESIDFDSRGDVIVVAVAGREPDAPVVLRHLIHEPQRVDLLERSDASLVVHIVDAAGIETLLTFQP
jgi:hypothetical protein